MSRTVISGSRQVSPKTPFVRKRIGNGILMEQRYAWTYYAQGPKVTKGWPALARMDYGSSRLGPVDLRLVPLPSRPQRGSSPNLPVPRSRFGYSPSPLCHSESNRFCVRRRTCGVEESLPHRASFERRNATATFEADSGDRDASTSPAQS